MVRQPIVSGRFYASSQQECLAQLSACIPATSGDVDAAAVPIGALVPHAGWTCSGRVTGRVLRVLADRTSPDAIVLLGAVHAVRSRFAAVYDRGSWKTPLGKVTVDEALARALLRHRRYLERDPEAHNHEHSLEVQVPFVQKLWPGVRIVPVMIPPSQWAPQIGRLIGQTILDQGGAVAVVGTSDLTHYGPGYGMTSHGIGQAGLDWAKSDNDQRMIDLILALAADDIVPEAQRHLNACGSGAIAATIEACAALGAGRAMLLEHTTSQETLGDFLPQPVTDAVGYAGILFCR